MQITKQSSCNGALSTLDIYLSQNCLVSTVSQVCFLASGSSGEQGKQGLCPAGVDLQQGKDKHVSKELTNILSDLLSNMKKNKQGSRGGVWCCRGLKVRKEAATQGRRLRSRPGDYKGQGAEDSKCGHLKKAGKTNVARTE